MTRLHNRVNKKELKSLIHTSREPRTTLSFYKYHQIENPGAFRDQLFSEWSKMGVMGRVYIAHEGINAQISVPEDQFDAFVHQLYRIPFLKGARLNKAIEDDSRSFYVLKVQVKKKIVSDGLHDNTFDASNSGVHLDAKSFNALADAPGTVIVDMRNHYESEVGHFRNAIRPDVDTFRESLPIVEKMLEDHKEQPVIMYCTGGIRCEKASAWMKHRGFKKVFQLDGGIIEYARQVRNQHLENKFVGKNFVFDERLGERISDDIVSVCHQCGNACDTHTNCRNDACHLLFIQCPACAERYNGCCSDACKEIIHLPAEAQRELRKGKAQGRQVFKKGRSSHLREKSVKGS